MKNNTILYYRIVINSVKFAGILFFIAIFSSCVRDGLDECPEGQVRLRLFVEKFRNKSQDPLADREDIFSDRVSHLRYFLYKDGGLKDQGIIDQLLRTTSGNCHTFDFKDLEFGDYKMLVVANSSKTALTGDAGNGDNLLLTFPGCDDTEDFFSAVFPFTVESNELKEYEVGLARTHGVIRYTFKNMPAEVSDIEIVMENVGSEKWITGDYKIGCKANKRYIMVPVSRQATTEDYVIGTFPTLTGQRSAYHLNLYRAGDTVPYINYMVSDTLTVVRNQLLEIGVTFNNGALDFEIKLDSDWDGTSSGSEVGIQ